MQSKARNCEALDSELQTLETTVAERANVYKVQQANDPDGGAQVRHVCLGTPLRHLTRCCFAPFACLPRCHLCCVLKLEIAQLV
eukprot:m.387248 g.387248  ORF g.387248 m.387248 type:complete len:84 (-) comp20062_c1_seq5:203-454(-)